MGNGPTKEEKQIAEIAEKVDSFSAGWAQLLVTKQDVFA